MSKMVFIDVDGTLTDFDGNVPASSREACKKAQANGHKLVLCTGRSKAELFDFILDIGFDGIIGAGGGFVEYNDEMLYHKKVSDEDVRHMVDFFNEKEMDFYLESNGGLYASKNLNDRLEKMLYGDLANDPEARRKKAEEPNAFITEMINDAPSLYVEDVNKACFLESKNVPFEEVVAEFKDKFQVMQCTVPAFGKDSGELVIPNVNKAVAIEYLLNHLAVKSEDTVAIGDGMNDLEMFEYCATTVAMGNAAEGLKEAATFVTEAVDKDGFALGFEKLGLI